MGEHKKIAERFKKVRETLRLTQKQLARKINVSITTICEIENGKHKPNCDCLENISLVFSVNLYWLLFGEGEIFLDPVNLVINQYGDSSSYHEVRKFLHYFQGSAIIRHSTLSNWYALMIQQKQNIEKEIQENERVTGKENGEIARRA